MINNLLTGDAWPRRPGWWCVCEMFFTELLFCFPPLFFLQLIRFRSVPRDLVLISCGVVSFSHVTTPCSSLSPEGSIAPAPNPPTHSSFSHLYFFSFFFLLLFSYFVSNCVASKRWQHKRSKGHVRFARARNDVRLGSFFLNGLLGDV